MNIKTFPLQNVEDRHNKIKKAARDQGLSMKEYIDKAIDEKIEKDKKGE